MSQENVDRVRDVYAEWAQGNVRAAVEMFHPEIAFASFMPDASKEVVAHGPAGVAAFMREFLAQWADYRLIGEEFRDADDKVFVAGRHKGRGRVSGVEVEQPNFSVWTFRSEKVVELRFTPFREIAFEVAGLSE